MSDYPVNPWYVRLIAVSWGLLLMSIVAADVRRGRLRDRNGRVWLTRSTNSVKFWIGAIITFGFFAGWIVFAVLLTRLPK